MHDGLTRVTAYYVAHRSDYFSDKVPERLPGRVNHDSRAEPARLPMRVLRACFGLSCVM